MKWYQKLFIYLAMGGAVVFIVEHKKSGTSCCAGGGCLLVADQTCMPIAEEGVSAEQPLPKLLDLGADKCVPCKMMENVLEDLEKIYANQLTVEFIDVWKNEEAGRAYQIRMIPTQIFFDPDGKELFRHEGFISEEDILAKWHELGFVFAEASAGPAAASSVQE